MKKIAFFGLLLFIISCNDGNFETPSFNFDDAAIENCGNLVVYKINESEVLLLEINEDNTNDIYFKTPHENKAYNLNNTIYYRTYTENVPPNYFCNAIPPSTPKLENEWIGSGTLIINNTITDNNDGTFTYIATFTINDMVLENGNGNSIIYDTYDFGTKTGTY